MRFSPLVLATAASAMLVVPYDDEEAFNSLPYDDVEAEVIPLPLSITNTAVQVPCQQCRGENAQIELNFAVVESELYVNGLRLFPSPEGNFIAEVSASDSDSYEHPVGLGVTLGIVEQFFDVEAGISAMDLWFTIREVDGHWMDDIPSLKVELVQNLDGQIISIGDSDVDEVPETPNEPAAPPSCDDMLCSALDWVHEAMQKFKSKAKTHCPHSTMMIIGGQDDLDEEQQEEYYKIEEVMIDVEEVEDFEEPAPRPKKVYAHRKPIINIWRVAMAYVVFPILLGVTVSVGCVLYVFSPRVLVFTHMLTKALRIAMAVTTVYIQICSLFRRSTGTIRLADEESATDEKARLQERDLIPRYED